MRWALWVLTGVLLLMAILLSALLLSLARLNPWLARRLAGSAVAAAILSFFCEIATLRLGPRRD